MKLLEKYISRVKDNLIKELVKWDIHSQCNNILLVSLNLHIYLYIKWKDIFKEIIEPVGLLSSL